MILKRKSSAYLSRNFLLCLADLASPLQSVTALWNHTTVTLCHAWHLSWIRSYIDHCLASVQVCSGSFCFGLKRLLITKNLSSAIAKNFYITFLTLTDSVTFITLTELIERHFNVTGDSSKIYSLLYKFIQIFRNGCLAFFWQ